jgi:hypothetical protein
MIAGKNLRLCCDFTVAQAEAYATETHAWAADFIAVSRCESGVWMCSGRTPTPTTRAGIRRRAGNCCRRRRSCLRGALWLKAGQIKFLCTNT